MNEWGEIEAAYDAAPQKLYRGLIADERNPDAIFNQGGPWRGVGRHWTTDPEMAHEFAHGMTPIPSDISNTDRQHWVPMVMSADWGGEGQTTDPDDLDDLAEYDENEINLNRGTPLRATSLQIHSPKCLGRGPCEAREHLTAPRDVIV